MRSLYRESKKNHSVTSGISSQHFSPGHGRRESNGLGRRWHWKPKQIWQDYCPSEWGRFTTWRQHLNLNALRLKSFFLLKVELADTFKCNSIHFSKKCVTGVTLTRQEKETRGALAASTEEKLMDNYFLSNFFKDYRRNILPLFHLRPHIISINDQYRKWEVMNDRNFPL